MTIGELKKRIEDVAKNNKITMSMLIATVGIEIAAGKKTNKKVAPARPRVYVEIQKHMTVGKFEMMLEAVQELTPDVLDAQILYGLKQALKGEVYRVE